MRLASAMRAHRAYRWPAQEPRRDKYDHIILAVTRRPSTEPASRRTLDPGFFDDGAPPLDLRSHLLAKLIRRLNLRLDALNAQPIARVG